MKKAMKRITVLLLALLLLIVPLNISAAKVSGNVLKGTIKVDGEIDELWEAADKIMLTFNVQGIATDNATAYGKLLWDSKYLYLLGVVTDSTPTPSNRDGEATWNHDSYEIFYDETNEKIDKNSMVQFRVNSLDGKVSGMIDDVVVDAKTLTDLYKGFKSDCKKTADGYVVEMAIPWTKTTAKADSTQFGFCLQVNDDQNFEGGADGIITNPVPNRFEPKQYPTYQLSSKEAKVKEDTSGNTSSNKPSGNTSSNKPSGNTSSTSSVTIGMTSGDNADSQTSSNTSTGNTSSNKPSGNTSSNNNSSGNASSTISISTGGTSSTTSTSSGDASSTSKPADNTSSTTSTTVDNTSSTTDGTVDGNVDGNVDGTTDGNVDNNQEATTGADANETGNGVSNMDPNVIMLIILGSVIVFCTLGTVILYILVLRPKPKK